MVANVLGWGGFTRGQRQPDESSGGPLP
jgi:hypothetical protein